MAADPSRPAIQRRFCGRDGRWDVVRRHRRGTPDPRKTRPARFACRRS
jgi:hypothetical protein